MAYQSFKLVLVHDNNHAEALNNLGVLEWKRGRGEVVRARKGHKGALTAVKSRWCVFLHSSCDMWDSLYLLCVCRHSRASSRVGRPAHTCMSLSTTWHSLARR